MARRSAAARIASHFEVNVHNKAIDALFIVAQHDGCKWAHECRFVKDLCSATRTEKGLWSAMARVHYGRRKRTLLMFEAQRGRLDRVQWLLARGAPRDARNALGQTALTLACLNDYTDIVRALIAAGAGVDITTNSGNTPLHNASVYGHSDTVRALIAAGAGVNIVCNSGWAPLHLASRRGHTDTVRALIAAGAGVNIADNIGWTPLRYASSHGHTDIVRALRDAGGI
jgi:ankyrin repeat protein